MEAETSTTTLNESEIRNGTCRVRTLAHNGNDQLKRVEQEIDEYAKNLAGKNIGQRRVSYVIQENNVSPMWGHFLPKWMLTILKEPEIHVFSEGPKQAHV